MAQRTSSEEVEEVELAGSAKSPQSSNSRQGTPTPSRTARQSPPRRSTSLEQSTRRSSMLSDDPLLMQTSPASHPASGSASGSRHSSASLDPLALDSQASVSSSPPVRATTHGRNKAKGRAHASDEDSDLVYLSETPRPQKRLRGGRSSAAKKRGAVYVEIPQLPLSTLRLYAVENADDRPSQSSRRKALRDQEDEYEDQSDGSTSVQSVSPSPPSRRTAQALRQGPTWRVVSDDEPWGYGDEDEDEDEAEESDESDDEAFSTRRSKRTRARRQASLYPERRTRSRTSRPLRKDRNRSRRERMLNSRRSTNSVADDDESEASEDSVFELNPDEGEDELEDDESDNGRVVVDGESEDLLRAHRPFCEKCSRGPADEMREKARARKRRPGKRRKKDDDEISDEELADSLEGWLHCTKCVVSSHWGCLAPTQQRQVLNALLNVEGPPRPGETRRTSIAIDETYTFTCARCRASPECFVCHKEHLPEDEPVEKEREKEQSADGVMEVEHRPEAHGQAEPTERDRSPDVMDVNFVQDPETEAQKDEEDDRDLLFRCLRCKQACHYVHLKDPFEADEEHDIQDIANHYQLADKGDDPWTCHQCREWVWNVDMICAWRPLPANAKEPKLGPGEKAHYKDPLPREYLVKWNDRGFRHVTWVPHAWLQTTSQSKLRNFLDKGPNLDLVTDETLAAKGDEMAQPTIANIMDEEDKAHKHHRHGEKNEWEGRGPAPEVDAINGIPQEWKTVDRVLDVCLMLPKKIKKAKSRRNNRVVSPSASPPGSEDEGGPKLPRHPDGLEPPEEDMIEIDEWEKRAGRILTEDDLDEIAPLVTWCFVKWDDLQYEQACWDTPPPIDSSLYPAFKKALGRYLAARTVNIPVLTSSQCKQRDAEAAKQREPPQSQPDCIVGGKLMDFQVQGFQWLLFKYFKRESCILADDMGLGKTIQIASLLGYLGSSELNIYPFLVIVPNSTITNWVREFEKWVPHMRVVPYYGQKASRKIISQYELYHKGLQGKAVGLKAHVVLTTYDAITGGDFRVFSSVPRWEALIVDEGQRLKSDSNLIFNRLKTLNAVHRILLTGTPLNNNLRELFNLLNFLDPDTFSDLADLEERFATLNESLVQELHSMIRPYILRRIKADVLKLPPKIEIIVPISLAPLQKNVYKTILERNGDVLKAIADAKSRKAKRANVEISGGGEIIVKKGGKISTISVTEANEQQSSKEALEADLPSPAPEHGDDSTNGVNDTVNGTHGGEGHEAVAGGVADIPQDQSMSA